MLSCEFCNIYHNSFLKNHSNSCFCINTLSVCCPNTTFHLVKNVVTHIFWLSMSWRRFCKTSWRRLLKTKAKDVFWRWGQKTSSRRLADRFIKTNNYWAILKIQCTTIILTTYSKQKSWKLKVFWLMRKTLKIDITVNC